MKQTIALMCGFLEARSYVIEADANKLSIVKHHDDPWNWVNQFLARPDGVYNYIEVQMGGYQERKRVSCRDFDTACFLVLAQFVARERMKRRDHLLRERIQAHAASVLNHSQDFWRGQHILSELASFLPSTGR